MEIADLLALIAVIEQGGITSGARALNKVPSGITNRILRLEAALGKKLFLRERRKLIPTPMGRDFYERAKKIVHLLDEMDTLARNPNPGGMFRIGAMESTLAGILIKPLAKFHSKYPNVNLEVITGTSTSLYWQLLDNKLDAIFDADVPCGADLEMVKIFDEKLKIVTPADYPSIRGTGDFRKDTVLAFSEGCLYRERLLKWLFLEDVRPCRIITMTSCHAILGSIAAGMGVGVLPASLLATFPQKETIAIYPLGHSLERVEMNLIWKKDMCSSNAHALLECMKNTDN